MDAVEKSRIVLQISQFLNRIGINVAEGPTSQNTFLPGVEIVSGGLVYDLEKLLYPGDLLHEAGHIALIPSDLRHKASGNIVEANLTDGGEEIGVMLWTYAACLEIGMAPEVVFHTNGYKGSADWLIQEYKKGSFIGLPLLQWMQLCAPDTQQPAFPHMLKWLRD